MTIDNGVIADARKGQLAPGTLYFEIASAQVGDRFAIWITLPPGYEREADELFPVIYVTDGNTNALLASAAAFLVAGDHLRPVRPFVQVCIGYADDDVGRRFIRRNRDFLPPGEPFSPLQARHVQARAYAETLGVDGMREFLHFAANGRADCFLRFIETELHPEIARSVRIAGDDAALYGHSQGGLFALWALVSGSHLFRTYGAASPAIMVENSCVFDLYRQRVARARAGDAGIHLHMVINDLEMTGDIPLYRAIGRGFLAFVDLVKGQPMAGLTLSAEIRCGETHFSAMLESYRSFLQACYRR
jgi:uncharacterized protein